MKRFDDWAKVIVIGLTVAIVGLQIFIFIGERRAMLADVDALIDDTNYASGTSFDLVALEHGKPSLYIQSEPSKEMPVCFCATEYELEFKGSTVWMDMYDQGKPRGCVIISRDESRDGNGNWTSRGQVFVCGELSRTEERP